MNFDDCKLEPKENNFEILCNKVEQLENRLKEYKAIEQEQKEIKLKLKKAMEENNIKSWKTLNGTTITLIADTLDQTYNDVEFDIDRFMQEQPKLFEEYLITKEKIKLGKSGYIKVTLSKE